MKKLMIALVAGVLVAAGVWVWLGADAGPQVTQRAEQLTLGRTVYAENCASCHGINLEGQPDWKSRNANGRMPAPPHDATGHTWHHADAQLFAITKFGTAAVVRNGYQSDMPGFGDTLSDDEISAVLAYIKSTWPDQEAAYQRQVSGL